MVTLYFAPGIWAGRPEFLIPRGYLIETVFTMVHDQSNCPGLIEGSFWRILFSVDWRQTLIVTLFLFTIRFSILIFWSIVLVVNLFNYLAVSPFPYFLYATRPGNDCYLKLILFIWVTLCLSDGPDRWPSMKSIIFILSLIDCQTHCRLIEPRREYVHWYEIKERAASATSTYTATSIACETPRYPA